MSEEIRNEVKVFYCNDDSHDKWVWETDEYKLHDDVDHAPCPFCGKLQRERSYRLLNVAKAWRNITGPKTAAGKRRSSLNNWKTGEHAKTFAIVAPAIPGRFPACNGCEFREPCENEPYKYCPVMVAPMMRVVAAYEAGDLSVLKELAGLQHARLATIVEMQYQSLIELGVMLPAKIFVKTNKDGDEVTETLEWQKNPILESLPKYIELMGLTARQQQMTPENQTAAEHMSGYLEIEKDKKLSMDEYKKNQLKTMAELKYQLRTANLARQNDPAFKAFQASNGDGGAIEADFEVEED